jgi:hypothetical protein
MNPRRRSGCSAAARVARINNQPRPGSRPDRERVSAPSGTPDRACFEEDWMKPLDEDDLRALEAAWGFVE